MTDRAGIDLSQLSDRELRKLELQIARKHSGMFPWGIVVWAFLNLAVWLSLWPLVLLDIIPLWLGFVVASVNLSLVYLPTHDAQHHIIGRPGTRWYWLNELVGHATSWMILTPFEVWRITHMDHHRHTNDPELDVDITSHADNGWQAIWRSIRQRQPDSKRQEDYAASVQRAGREDLLGQAALFKLGHLAFLFAMAWSGYALEVFLLWWLPYHIAITYLVFFLSWAPHSPNMGQGCYRDTKNWRSQVGNILSMGMQYHIVHHLHPYIPLMQTGAAYREMKPILEARGCKLEM
ncbi:fatty acid desaturase [Parerythrobacter jejuensis]|uniref:fatty acid desaturase n=1 Tax=Parerythrobacter jejuensis TaxID=795812 RepID=UPI001F19C7E3|nr:fatty acid desaturase [Parerythrobacter jejuensis]